MVKETGKKILIVDKDSSSCKILTMIMGEEAVIEIASNGVEGLNKLKSEYFDLIISDVEMPYMNGIDMYLEASKMEPEISDRFLFVTGTAEHDYLSIIKKEGLSYIEKPIRINKIRRMATKILNSSINCWEHMQCGKEQCGDRADELGICPAVTESKVDGVHGGKNGGRACWIVGGTFCGGEVQGSFADKFNFCMDCSFYIKVMKEEGDDITSVNDLLLEIES